MSPGSLVRPVWRWVTRPVGSVRAISAPGAQVVLTYDDGPEPAQTPAVLEALREHKATATFFLLTPRALKHRSLLQEVMAAGHEIALHGIDHTRLTDHRPAEVLRRCRDGKAILEDLTGKQIRWFRAPYGAMLFPHWTAVRRAGLEHVGWGPSANDWVKNLTEEQMAQSALNDTYAGEIVLAHDGYASLEDGVDDGPEPNVDKGKIAHLILAGLASQGLQARSLGDALTEGDTSPRRWAWFRH